MPEAADIGVLGPTALAADHDAELPQKDQLCGAFWTCLALRAYGVRERGGEPVDQDLVAREAGTTLAEGDPLQWVPPGERSRADYRLELPMAADPATGGTAASTLGNAVERVSEGALIAVPVAGPWTATTVTRLLEIALELVPDSVLIANLRTGPLWATRPAPALLLAVLAGEKVEGPPCEWDEGHFVSLAMLVRGAGGVLVGIRDTYRSLGWNAQHLQPPEAVAAALARGDGREGGVLCVVRAGEAGALRARLASEGFELRDWDNGSYAVAAAT
jgi:hypothetical protein